MRRDSPLDLERMNRMYDSLPDKALFLRETGINLSTLRNALNGVSNPTVGLVAAFAGWFGVPCGSLFADYGKYHNAEERAAALGKFSKTVVLKDAVLFYNE